MPFSVMSKPGIKLADCTMLPAQNSAEPATEIAGGKVDDPFMGCTASETRPAQPVPPDPKGFPACMAIT